MPSNNYAKIIAQKWNSGRDIADVRKRNSTRLLESRRSQRSAAINQFRQGLDISEEVVKKSAAEEKLERLKAYKAEKQKKMEEIKKKQRPPFCSMVKARHTGGTPFRQNASVQPRTRSQTRNLFEFKATLPDTKNGKLKTVASRAIENHEGKKPPVKKNQVAHPQQNTTTSSKKPNIRQLTKSVVEKKNNAAKETKLVENKNIANKENTVVVEKTISVPKETVLLKTTSNGKKNIKGTQEAKIKLTDVTNSVDARSESVSCSSTELTTRKTRGRLASNTISEVKNSTKVGVKTRNAEIKEELPLPEHNDSEYEERKKGTNFHRSRLNHEIDRLTNQSDAWSNRNKENIPEHIKDEILVVVGQTKLLLSQKFMDFKNLIDRCESIQSTNDVKVTLQDLEGFWDMMYQQVIQLDRKYKNLQELESNDWQEEISYANGKKSKKVVRKRKSPVKKQVSSRFKEFLKSKQQSQTNSDTPKKLLDPEISSVKGKEMEDDSSFYHSASGGGGPFNETLVASETSQLLSDVQRTINSDRNSRRSSAGLIILRQRLLMKSISSPQKNSK